MFLAGTITKYLFTVGVQPQKVQPYLQKCDCVTVFPILIKPSIKHINTQFRGFCKYEEHKIIAEALLT